MMVTSKTDLNGKRLLGLFPAPFCFGVLHIAPVSCSVTTAKSYVQWWE